mgnify:CR=1 FL=1
MVRQQEASQGKPENDSCRGFSCGADVQALALFGSRPAMTTGRRSVSDPIPWWSAIQAHGHCYPTRAVGESERWGLGVLQTGDGCVP